MDSRKKHKKNNTYIKYQTKCNWILFGFEFDSNLVSQ